MPGQRALSQLCLEASQNALNLSTLTWRICHLRNRWKWRIKRMFSLVCMVMVTKNANAKSTLYILGPTHFVHVERMHVEKAHVVSSLKVHVASNHLHRTPSSYVAT